MKYPVVKPKRVITYYNISHTGELTDFEIMELFRKDASVTVLDYDSDEAGHYWRVCVEWEVRLYAQD